MSDGDAPSQLPTGYFLQDLLDQQGVQEKITESQSRVRADNAELGALGMGIDPDYVHTEDHFEGMTHEEMYAAVHGGPDGSGGLDAAGLQEMRRTWFECQADLVNLSSFNLLGMNRIFGNGLWQGASGSAAQTASEQYSHVVNQVGRVFDSVSQRLDAVAWAAESVRIAVPPPPPTLTGAVDPDNSAQSLLPGLTNPEYAQQLDDARKQARDQAIQALNAIYKGNVPPAGSGVPTYALVPQIGLTGDPGVVNGNNLAAAGTNPEDSASPANPETNAPAEENAPSEETGSGDSHSPTETSPTDTDSTGTDTGDTSPAGVRPPENTATTPSSTTAPAGVGSTPGSPSSTPLGQTPNALLGSDTPRTGGPGSAITGVPAAPTLGSASLATGPASTSRPGVGPMGPMAPGAAARRKEDDAEHYAPDYLRGVAPDWTKALDHTTGVIGGGDFPASGTSANTDSPTRVDPQPTQLHTASGPRNTVDSNVSGTADTSASLPSGATAPSASGQTRTSDAPEPAGPGPQLRALYAEYGWSTSPETPPVTQPDRPEGGPPASKPGTDR